LQSFHIYGSAAVLQPQSTCRKLQTYRDDRDGTVLTEIKT